MNNIYQAIGDRCSVVVLIPPNRSSATFECQYPSPSISYSILFDSLLSFVLEGATERIGKRGVVEDRSHVHQAHTHGLLSRHINARQWSPLNIFLSFPCSNVGNPIEYSFEVNQFPLFQFEAQRSLCKLSLRSRVSFLSYLFRLVPSQHYPEGVVGSNTSCPLLPARVHVRWIARRRFFIPSCRISRHTTEEYCLPSFNHASASTSALISSAVKSYRFTTNLYLYLFPSFSTFFAEIGYLHSAHVGHNSTCRSDGSRIRRRRIFWFRKYQKELEQRK